MNLEKQIVQKYPILGSSQNPEEVSLSIKGALITLLPIISLFFSFLGLEASQELLAQFTNAIFGVMGGIMVIIGLLRKFKKG